MKLIYTCIMFLLVSNFECRKVCRLDLPKEKFEFPVLCQDENSRKFMAYAKSKELSNGEVRNSIDVSEIGKNGELTNMISVAVQTRAWPVSIFAFRGCFYIGIQTWSHREGSSFKLLKFDKNNSVEWEIKYKGTIGNLVFDLESSSLFFLQSVDNQSILRSVSLESDLRWMLELTGQDGSLKNGCNLRKDSNGNLMALTENRDLNIGFNREKNQITCYSLFETDLKGKLIKDHEICISGKIICYNKYNEQILFVIREIDEETKHSLFYLIDIEGVRKDLFDFHTGLWGLDMFVLEDLVIPYVLDGDLRIMRFNENLKNVSNKLFSGSFKRKNTISVNPNNCSAFVVQGLDSKSRTPYNELFLFEDKKKGRSDE